MIRTRTSPAPPAGDAISVSPSTTLSTRAANASGGIAGDSTAPGSTAAGADGPPSSSCPARTAATARPAAAKVRRRIGRWCLPGPAICVGMEGGGGTSPTGYWSDWLDGTYQWETWHLHTLIPWVDAHFRTMQGVRGAIGAALGSTGELDYAEHSPGLFRSIATFSGLVDTQA